MKIKNISSLVMVVGTLSAFQAEAQFRAGPVYFGHLGFVKVVNGCENLGVSRNDGLSLDASKNGVALEVLNPNSSPTQPSNVISRTVFVFSIARGEGNYVGTHSFDGGSDVFVGQKAGRTLKIKRVSVSTATSGTGANGVAILEANQPTCLLIDASGAH